MVCCIAPRLERLAEPATRIAGDATTIQPTTGDAIERLTFDEALAELQRTVAELEAGGQPLEASLALYERGVALQRALRPPAARCGAAGPQLVARAGGVLEAQDVRPDEAREASDGPEAAGG